MTSSQAWTESYATEVRTKLRSLMDASTKTALAVAELLFGVYYDSVKTKSGDVPIWQAWGFESFGDYAEVELEIHHGAAMAYVFVWDELYVRRSFEPGVLPNSITKLKQLARISRKHRGDTREILRWVARSKEMNCCEFENAVDQEFGERGRRRTIGFVLKWTKARELMKAVGSAKEEFGVSTNGEALTQIVDEWLDYKKSAGRRAKAS